ncbi:hypothetical protein [Amycolatopsis pigmentata]|uniref:Uncharacterized protein n=1 Tax=Amycolatopsis pigmentata TaxID=450801 RepID=A0ABW5G7P9_9PSEU
MRIKGIAAAATLLAAGATLLAGPIAGATASSPYPQDGSPATCAPAAPAPGDGTPSTGPVDQAPTAAPGTGLTAAPAPAQRSEPTRVTVPSERLRGLTDCSPRTGSAPQVRVRPLGAPQTGDGSLAVA